MKKLCIALALVLSISCILCACSSGKWSKDVLNKADLFAETYTEEWMKLSNPTFKLQSISGSVEEQSDHTILFTGKMTMTQGSSTYTSNVRIVLEYEEDIENFSVKDATFKDGMKKVN